MKRYAFSLDRVLRVRSTQEGMARQVLRGAATRASQADVDYEYVDRCYQASIAGEASIRGSLMSLLAMRDLDTMRARAVIEAEVHREEAHNEADAARAAWTQAKQKVSALEQLDERQRAEYDREVLHEQDVEADDIVTSRRSRSSQLRMLNSGDGESV